VTSPLIEGGGLKTFRSSNKRLKDVFNAKGSLATLILRELGVVGNRAVLLKTLVKLGIFLYVLSNSLDASI